MTDLIERLRAFEGSDELGNGDFSLLFEAAAKIEELREALTALKAENETLRTALNDADNELDWLDEDMDTCDHSVGVCMCSYWGMRRKMKAALAKENRNG